MKKIIALILLLVSIEIAYSQTCAWGQYASGGVCVKCPLGTSSMTTGATSCTKCDAGTIAAALGSYKCTACPSGQFSNDERTKCAKCPVGFFAFGGVCNMCAVGSVAATEGLTTCTKCPAGSTSSLDKKTCVKCPSGSYSTTSGSDCLKCPSGKTSTAGATSCTDCPMNTYGKDGLCVACPLNTASLAGGQSIDACIKCDLNYVLGADGKCAACPDSSPYAVDSKTCNTNCPAGGYTENNQCISCPDGFVSQVSGSITCFACSYGMYADAFTNCKKCPKGTFNNFGGVNQCAKCPPGTYTGYEGSAYCIRCADNFVPDTSQTKCVACPAGQIAKSGSSSCSNCPKGTSWDKAKKSCQPCGPGTYSSDGTACKLCPAGTYSFMGETSEYCNDCPAGMISTTDRKTCVPCPPGTMEDGTRSNCTDCPAGKYSNAGASSCDDCPAGTFRYAFGPGCMNCNSGYYSDLDGSTQCKLCPPKTYTSSDPSTQATSCDDQPTGQTERGRSLLVNCPDGVCPGPMATKFSSIMFAFSFMAQYPSIQTFLFSLPTYLDPMFRLFPTINPNLVKITTIADIMKAISGWTTIDFKSNSVVTNAKATISAALGVYATNKINISDTIKNKLIKFVNDVAPSLDFSCTNDFICTMTYNSKTLDVTNDYRQLYLQTDVSGAIAFGEWLGMFVEDALYLSTL